VFWQMANNLIFFLFFFFFFEREKRQDTKKENTRLQEKKTRDCNPESKINHNLPTFVLLERKEKITPKPRTKAKARPRSKGIILHFSFLK
jgi:hypothetical protein